ncbi:transcriptional regulator, TetR family [Variovorax sp. HW608]|nr:transcriptional regulator, TetR family [Variovorax sp. HW608]
MKDRMSVPATSAPPARSTYRHGDLRRALLAAGVELARAGGPEAVVLREATRRAGVVPNAAYRHFESRQALLQAVRAAALSAVARAMEAELATLQPMRDPAAFARATVRAVGAGYLRFAQSETGLFRTAFATQVDVQGQPEKAMSGDSGLDPFQLLGAALDRLVEAGAMPAARRPGAEFLAWSAVHGLAMLVIDGPLRDMPRAQVDALGQRLLDMVEKGL